MYVWDVPLESFPCGWDYVYDEIKKEYPFGVYFNFSIEDGKLLLSKEKTAGYRYINVSEYKKRMLEKYRKLAEEAKQIFADKNGLDIPRLFTIDVLMWGIVFDYTRDLASATYTDRITQFEVAEFYSEESMWEKYEDYEGYFGVDYFEVDGLPEPVFKFVSVSFKNDEKAKHGKYTSFSKNVMLEKRE